MIGQKVESYLIVRELGRGGMGAVFEMRHETLGRRAAIKVLLPEFSRNQDIVARFFNEARAVNIIQHPGIVDISDVGTLPTGEVYILMEFLEGESLGRRLARLGKLSLTATMQVGVQVAAALVAAHQKSIVHRDLKPDNVMLVPDRLVAGGERAKLVDFGIAKLAAQQMTPGYEHLRTETGVMIGTPAYMSPEQCRGAGSLGTHSDVYSFGVMLFLMCSGVHPFSGSAPGEIIAQHMMVMPPHLNNVPMEFADLVGSMLSKKPENRPTMNEVLAKLASWTGMASIAEASTTRKTRLFERANRPVSSRRTDTRRLVGLLFGLSSMIIISALWLVKPRKVSDESTDVVDLLSAGRNNDAAHRPDKNSEDLVNTKHDLIISNHILNAKKSRYVNDCLTFDQEIKKVLVLDPRNDLAINEMREPCRRTKSRVDLVTPRKGGLDQKPRRTAEPLTSNSKFSTGKPGYLIARTTPSSKVFVDGIDTGLSTPINAKERLLISSGMHTISFEVNGRKFSFAVFIAPDKEVNLVRNLSDVKKVADDLVVVNSHGSQERDIETAKIALKNGSPLRAINLVRQYNDLSVWRIRAEAACMMQDERLANESFKNLDEIGKQYAQKICQKNGIPIGNR